MEPFKQSNEWNYRRISKKDFLRFFFQVYENLYTHIQNNESLRPDLLAWTLATSVLYYILTLEEH